MDTKISQADREKIEAGIREKYAQVAKNPEGQFKYQERISWRYWNNLVFTMPSLLAKPDLTVPLKPKEFWYEQKNLQNKSRDDTLGGWLLIHIASRNEQVHKPKSRFFSSYSSLSISPFAYRFLSISRGTHDCRQNRGPSPYLRLGLSILNLR